MNYARGGWTAWKEIAINYIFKDADDFVKKVEIQLKLTFSFTVTDAPAVIAVTKVTINEKTIRRKRVVLIGIMWGIKVQYKLINMVCEDFFNFFNFFWNLNGLYKKRLSTVLNKNKRTISSTLLSYYNLPSLPCWSFLPVISTLSVGVIYLHLVLITVIRKTVLIITKFNSRHKSISFIGSFIMITLLRSWTTSTLRLALRRQATWTGSRFIKSAIKTETLFTIMMFVAALGNYKRSGDL